MDEEVNILRESKGGSILKVEKSDGFSGQVNGGGTSSNEANQKFSDWNTIGMITATQEDRRSCRLLCRAWDEKSIRIHRCRFYHVQIRSITTTAKKREGLSLPEIF
jgi:hypothetical protein